MKWEVERVGSENDFVNASSMVLIAVQTFNEFSEDSELNTSSPAQSMEIVSETLHTSHFTLQTST